jgi:predicted dithiol-disulfide oxidoreductase (DUF899 family)
MPELHTKTFPNEDQNYREARNMLLDEEIALRRHIERVAKMRRELPLGGKLKEDYVFDEVVDGQPRKTKLSELFDAGKNSLIVYSMMYHPDDATPCTSCSSIIDGLDGSAPHIRDKVNFVVVTKAPIEKTLKWADHREWHNVRLLSSFSNTYNQDYFGENDKGGQTPILNVFTKTPEGIFHTFATELLFAPSDPGQNARHVDIIWPVWNMFDFTPEGRGTDWYPKHEYEKS